MKSNPDIGAEEVNKARQVLKTWAVDRELVVQKTPLLPTNSHTLLNNLKLFYKPENLQLTGSYKIRGMINVFASLLKKNIKGALMISSGNGGKAMAFLCKKLGLEAVIMVPDGIPDSKFEQIESFGAEVIKFQFISFDDLMNDTISLCQKRSLHYINPFEEPLMMAGAGTVGLEILDEMGDVDMVVVPVGSGTGIGGIAAAIKTRDASIKVIAVGHESNCFCSSFQQKQPIVLDHVHDTICDPLNVPFVTEYNLNQGLRYIDQAVMVSESETVNALQFLWQKEHLVVEPGGSVALAAVLSRKIEIADNMKVVCVLTGGNVDFKKVMRFLI